MHHPFLTSLSIPLYLNLHIVYLCSIQVSQAHSSKCDLGQQIQELKLSPLSRDLYHIEIFLMRTFKKNKHPCNGDSEILSTVFPDVTILRM